MIEKKQSKIRVLVVFGTRPEAIKMAPIVNELKTRKSIETVVCISGQHREMLNQVLDTFEITPDYNLDIMKDQQTLFDITTAILSKVQIVLNNVKPDLVLVHGDTTTTFATALASFYLNIPIGHVEAGLRTNDVYSPFPEEFNRRSVSLISTLDFAPTETARENLISEGKNENNIWVTGNTAIDALKSTIDPNYTDENLEWVDNRRLIIVTAHRRENLGVPMVNMFKAIKRVLDENEDVCAIYPIHLNPQIRKLAYSIFRHEDRIKLIDPLDVVEFHNYMNKSYLILTDSGGIQEEAPSLGKPVLVMRETTERPEGIKAGTLKLVGIEEESIYKEFSKLLTDHDTYKKMTKLKNPYGDGTASKKIADIIELNFRNKNN
ncbi:non-hydrolyzing UDP-N-acetylglucosamine 2-epimerase [Ileibacterium valens]|uniref:UDP-N-acetylglucosamine 2-epimerase (non-hydrolyzing) n=1 Tax=Ileibacterium valens TaxID=1862668 RepID=A0A1U7NF11_9FIRM|nr:UDP-N-acetylglucosamine 2-epimerase (non-hydrolyzing) [Ileibacterium valens]OLU38471.1 UDP-N-acetylglucosamine 2-epimerase [Erysipelotrichaceae bacterium NYU-BL-F16]OLU38506.1 UDP-N-acetylglucosamine 2-epimerase [Ileibacterium valens]OLU38820.1 UDP-N-acetylglucosamine 2-epimerase [Erysipelotrichaceae bacterium NYU-BL-E8]